MLHTDALSYLFLFVQKCMFFFQSCFCIFEQLNSARASVLLVGSFRLLVAYLASLRCAILLAIALELISARASVLLVGTFGLGLRSVAFGLRLRFASRPSALVLLLRREFECRSRMKNCWQQKKRGRASK